ncbi:MAG: hypothetical protein K5928_08595 [Prevotella sp.]|nr:hypothetical protein [Prevotella sp.]
MTKVDAIERVMTDNGGSASLQIIYDNIEKYYGNIKHSKDWKEGVRGVLYRELAHGTRFKKVGLSIYALSGYQEEHIEAMPKARVHSIMEGLCLELGNTKHYDTFTADPSAIYKDNTCLGNIATLSDIPNFSYAQIVRQARFIDVLWFNKSDLAFPQFAFEVVDSIGTLNGALNRCFQLYHFRTRFNIIAPEKYQCKFSQTLNLEIYKPHKERFRFFSYDEIIESYKIALDNERMESKLFG